MPPKKREENVIEADFVEETEKNQSLARYQHPAEDLALTPVFDLKTANERLDKLKEFVKSYLVEGEDYGTIPGTPKPTLYKPGADKLCDIYGLADTYKVTSRTEDWSKNLFDYEVECTLTSKRTGHLVSTGLASCSSFESKYHWRDQKRACPKCGKATIIKGRDDYGGGWICWKKEGKSDGCGAKFSENDTTITGQAVGRVENENIPDIKNTILKMSVKRSKVAAVLSASRSSGLFSQDLDDIVTVEDHEEKAAPPAAKPEPVKTAAPTKTAPPPVPKAAPKPVPTASPKPAAAPMQVPKAEIPKDLPGTVPTETPKKQPTEYVRSICMATGVSSTNLVAFMASHLAVDVDGLGKVRHVRIVGTLWALEETIKKFTGKEVAPMIMGAAEINPSVQQYFIMAYAKSQEGQ
jgi:outer membrane biosynthesis protein TonB